MVVDDGLQSLIGQGITMGQPGYEDSVVTCTVPAITSAGILDHQAAWNPLVLLSVYGRILDVSEILAQ